MWAGVRRSTRRTEPELDLPPVFRVVRLRESGDAFARALAGAAAEGAGTLVWVGRFDVAEFAVVLEPSEPLARARRAFYVGMTALLDALSVHAPPEKPIAVEWPDAIRVDGGLIGGGRLGWPRDTSEDETPQWLVFGALVRLAWLSESEIGCGAALEEEGFSDWGSGGLIESFGRHLMSATDACSDDGFEVIARSYLARLADRSGEAALDRDGDLLLGAVKSGRAARRSLARALLHPSWLDRQTGNPRP